MSLNEMGILFNNLLKKRIFVIYVSLDAVENMVL